ncbi:MAG: ABC transporter permease [Bacteroidetes bacterium]|nr:ABC transporter permease [Bacteroidota bacterium]
MNLPLFIAKRYFFSKKSQRAINIVSMISMLGVMIGTGALVVVLSVFNGFESLVISLYNSFDPDIKITAAEGKSFIPDPTVILNMKQMEGISAVSLSLEENALVKYHEKQYIATIKGVDENFPNVTGVDTMMVDSRTDGTIQKDEHGSGEKKLKFELTSGDTDFAIVGGGIAYNLQLNMGDFFSQLDIYAPRKNAGSLNHPEEAFNRKFISPSGVFAIQQEFDSKYILVPIRFAREMLENDSDISSIEVAIKKGADADEIKTQLTGLFGNKFKVQSRFEQHALLYRIMKSEKWAVFLILAFILLIATFNVVGSLTMLIIEKKKDIAVFYSMGADAALIRKIFFAEGLMITFIGAGLGLFFGGIICFLQQHFGFIQLGNSGSFVVDAYPVAMKVQDFISVFLTVFLIGSIAAWYPAKKLVERKINLDTVRVDE